MKLALQIVSKGLYHSSFSMRPDNSRVDTENAQDFEKRRSTTNKTLKTNVDGCHSKTKMSPPCQSNTERPKGNSGAGWSNQCKQREVFLVGDSILKNLLGRSMSSSAQVKISLFQDVPHRTWDHITWNHELFYGKTRTKLYFTSVPIAFTRPHPRSNVLRRSSV